ncbi:TPA_asm: protein 3 [Ranunculus virus 1]|uniref:Protein 3 n=1 Tax=Ranunculus virus 1 TaxID=2977983 RepID=A0A9N7AB42_9RHAB|nr:TPA_asm: protein 3 [Ranunculus virus 1]
METKPSKQPYDPETSKIMSKRLDSIGSVLSTKVGEISLSDNDCRLKYLSDPNAPDEIPKEKVALSLHWQYKVKGTGTEIDLGSIGVGDFLKNLSWKSGSLSHPEIHILWKSHLPVDNYRSNFVTVKFYFDGTDDMDEGLISQCKFSSPMHAHMIFYPKHSISLGLHKKLPWKFSFEISNTSIREDYNAADIYIKLVGYNTPVSLFTNKGGVTLISLVPLSEKFSGITLTRPRVGSIWKTGQFSHGIRDKHVSEKILMLQNFGIDIEGMSMLGLLHKLLKETKKINLQNNVESQVVACNIALGLVKAK